MRLCSQSDFATIHSIINDAAQAYKGVIPDDRWEEPYMTLDELRQETDDGVAFWGLERDGELVGVMGVQDRGDVHLLRHAYVATGHRREGVGTELLRHVESLVSGPILVGTWAAADWAISFYEKEGYRQVSDVEKDRLLRRYWNIPERQLETSVVLANERWAQAGA